MSDPAVEPQFQLDAMMKVLFSDHGDKDGVGLAQMTRQWADWAEERVRQWPDTHSGSADLLDRLGAGRTPW